MIKKLQVTIVIPNYNGIDLLKENIPHVVDAMKNKKNRIKEIIVVDDASQDESVAYLKTNFPKVRVIKHGINKRFSAAVNTGARMAKGNMICLLNNDVRPSRTFLEKVVPHFEDPNLFAVSLAEKDYSWAKGYFNNGFVEHEPGEKSNKPHESFWVSGGSGVFRRSMWMKLKGMDEVLFPPFYWEDVDLGYRALKRGWKLLWEPNSLVSHEHESTNKLFNSKYRSRIQERNQLLFIWKNITSKNLMKKHRAGLIKRLVKHPGYFRIYFMAALKYRAAKKLRIKELREATVSDESIFAKFQ